MNTTKLFLTRGFSLILACSVPRGYFQTTASAAEIQGASESEDAVYGYGTMTMTYAEFYAGDVNSAKMDAVSSATTTKSKTFPNADSTDLTDDGYKINGVKNVPVKVMESASDELKARVTLNAAGIAEPAQYKLVDESGIGAAVYNVKDTVTDANATLKTNSVWGEYEIDIVETSTSYLRNTRSEIKNQETGEVFEIGSQIQGVILETTEGYKVGAAHMENIWVQPWEVAFSLEGNANSSEFRKLVGKTINKVTYIMPTETYVYDLGEGVYIKPAYPQTVSGTFHTEGTKFTLDQELTGVTNAAITISYKEGRKITTLLEATALSGKEYTLTTAVPEGKYITVTISSDEYADITAEYPMMSWQRETLESLVRDAAEILGKLQTGILKEHKEEAEALLADQAASAGQANELIGELTGLVDSAKADLEKAIAKKLSETVDDAKKIVKEGYAEASWTAFENALAAAEAQLAAPGAVADMEGAITRLTQAMQSLTKETAGDTPAPEIKNSIKKGAYYTVKSLKYKVTNESVDGKGTVEVTGPQKKSAEKAVIPATVKIDNITFRVTSIGNNAFKNCKKLKSVKIGKNVTTIGKNAFFGASKCKSITITSKNLKKAGKNVWKGIHKSAKIKVPSAKRKAYTKLFKGKGQSLKVRIV